MFEDADDAPLVYIEKFAAAAGSPTAKADEGESDEAPEDLEVMLKGMADQVALDNR